MGEIKDSGQTRDIAERKARSSPCSALEVTTWGIPFSTRKGHRVHLCLTAPAGTCLAIRKENFYMLNSPFCFSCVIANRFLKLNILIASFVRRVFSHAYTGIVTS